MFQDILEWREMRGLVISSFPRPELALEIPLNHANTIITNWTLWKFQSELTKRFKCRQARVLIKESARTKANSLLSMSRGEIRIVTGMLIDHADLYKHLNTIRLRKDSQTLR